MYSYLTIKIFIIIFLYVQLDELDQLDKDLWKKDSNEFDKIGWLLLVNFLSRFPQYFGFTRVICLQIYSRPVGSGGYEGNGCVSPINQLFSFLCSVRQKLCQIIGYHPSWMHRWLICKLWSVRKLLLPATTKLGQGYVFTRVCDSVRGGVLLHAGIPPEQTPPQCSACWETRATSGRYASYWNANLLCYFLSCSDSLVSTNCMITDCYF